MPNINSNPAQIASAPLINEAPRTQTSAPVIETPAIQKAESLSTGEQVKMGSYTVKRGDTLWDIAGVKLGDNKKWPLLFALNQDKIKNPDLIYPGQVLTVPEKVEVAPPAPKPELPSPVDYTPAPVQEEPVVAVPSAPPAPVQETPPEPPSAETPVTLKPPSELPEPAPETPVQPTPPVVEPVAEQPICEPVTEAPVAPPTGVIGHPPVAEHKSSGVGKAALVGGAFGTVATGAVLIGVTKSLAPPLSNLGGYATAQVVAKSVNSVVGKVGLHVPTGPALTKIVSKVGGPKMAGAVTALAVGAVVAGVAAGGYYLYNRSNSKQEPAPAQKPAPSQPSETAVPTQAASPNAATVAAPSAAPAEVTTPAQAAAASEATPAENLQPVANDPATARAEAMKKLNETLGQKAYFGYGKITNPEAVSQLSEQIWVGATEIGHRLELAQTLVKNGQAPELGRIMSNMGVSDLEVAQLMAQPGFPTKEFMAGVDDNRATLLLISLSNVATTGEPETARLLKETADAFSGRFKDREAPFVRLKSHHENQGTWEQVPAEVRTRIETLIK
ncbi:hypothetical protein COW36_03840 [bacterium (Candidatus Blackallbacteria) CG17_big_fil_post_rev_8_21_14_2_50_48_46]|uniref:LysM domain-containing protein n=1 Tax=bacterium (Candidatus Blackallbacteria) CG17_big_fil_post_rev_8_21_14_2_50_48_46 TaxID=2014261 RepID=A0A2M7G8R4_9BACT|nr:MAG: hypothetical protein COW64_05105 [bacterium (Candidatus Blackallbacteria) CG18_big_fil_WC_8_21_14_2_50_49_26]PIW18431.1 MAG: hypothetical protein COW36_03840 [bacterium (Candidatus Blackallbacteria) CG17_big_fil_post_rev_8_21_14_2_50_48_46]PIW46584.1 MAG: hypothetical protein COW20_16840 [bacterium (Candidatus Blackallbacteria) CG13_big_fil_rev_8_21_14_2_50_49_14]